VFCLSFTKHFVEHKYKIDKISSSYLSLNDWFCTRISIFFQFFWFLQRFTFRSLPAHEFHAWKIRNPVIGGKIDAFGRIIFRKPILHSGIVLAVKVPKRYTDLDLTVLYRDILILQISHRDKFRFVWKIETWMLALGVFFPQPCSSAQVGRVFAASNPRLDYYRHMASFSLKRIGWNALWAWFRWAWESVFVRKNSQACVRRLRHRARVRDSLFGPAVQSD